MTRGYNEDSPSHAGAREDSEQESPDERAARLAVVASDVFARGNEYAQKSLMMLSGWEREAAKYFPDREMLATLPEEDMTAVLHLTGFLNSLVGPRSPWYVRFIDECDKALQAARDKQKMSEVIERLYAICALHVGVSTNTNSAGSSPRHQRELNDTLASEFADVGNTNAVEAIKNPYGIESGEVYYVPKRDKEGNLSLSEGRVGEMLVDGSDVLVDVEGNTQSINRLNFDIWSGQKLFRTGKRFVELPQLPLWLDRVASGELIDIHSKLPTGDMISTCTYLGSNEAEIEEQYGDAHRQALRDLLVFRVLYDGKEVEIPYKSRHMEIYPHKTSGVET